MMRWMLSQREIVEWRQEDIEEIILKRNETRQKRLQVEEETRRLKVELQERELLLIERKEVIDMLQQFGVLLQEERDLTKRLNDEAAAQGKQQRELRERIEHAQIKIQSLSNEKFELEQRLQKTTIHQAASQNSNDCPTTRLKKKQRIPK
uniref:A-kinase anchor protein 17A-like n=1 Tax=Doryrhamphus excisus TaxID=161450 RepID=UPI0025AE8AD9|nr:A-kinase anchor protein 17A-like [Doryrhamphus excisus]